MRPQKKQKTACFGHHPPPQRSKHYSVQIDPVLLSSRLAAYEFVDYLLVLTYQQVERSRRQAAIALDTLSLLQMPAEHYFDMEPTADCGQEVLCHLEDQPQPEGHTQLKVKPAHTHRSYASSTIDEESLLLLTERKAKEAMISKLKKESMSVRSSVYLSRTLPIQMQCDFIEHDTPQIEHMRRQKTKLSKVPTKKMSRMMARRSNSNSKLIMNDTKSSRFNEQQREARKSILLNDLDSVSQNMSMLASQVDLRRGSLVKIGRETTLNGGNEERCKAKQLPNEDITLLVEPSSVMVKGHKENRKGSSLHSRFPEIAREDLKMKIERSFHKPGKPQLRQVFESHKKLQTVESTSFLPRIKRL